MYANERSHVRVGEGYSEEFKVKFSVHQGSVLRLLLFIIVLEALSRKYLSGFLWDDLFADDLGIIAESFEECVRRLLTWKEAMEEKGLSKCKKDKDHDLCHRPGPPAEFRRVSMHSLTHLLKQLQALSAQEMQEGSRAWQRTLITDVHSARELHTPWTVDHRGKSKSNLSSCRW